MITGIGVASIYNRSNAKKNTGVSVVGRQKTAQKN